MKAAILILFLSLSGSIFSQNRLTGDLRNDQRKIKEDIEYIINYRKEGRITVDIVVNIDGKVTSAIINEKHTNVLSTPMHIEAKNRAKNLKFESCYHCPKFHNGSVVFMVKEEE